MENINSSKHGNVRPLSSGIIDEADPLEVQLARHGTTLKAIIENLSERDATEALNRHVGLGENQYQEVQLGQLFSALIDESRISSTVREMMYITRDGLSLVLSKLLQLVMERWVKLHNSVKTKILSLTKEFMSANVMGIDSVCQALMRQIAGGDLTPNNIWLAEGMLDIFTEFRPWLNSNPHVLSAAVYTYLRILTDHLDPKYSELHQKEVEFCLSLLREQWMDCISIGRDLVRLLQDVDRIPEFQSLWQDLLHNPSELSPQFTGIGEILTQRTSRKYLISRLTPDMERKLMFFTSHVKFGQHKRYQEWIQRQYLATPESQSLRCDLIRYICAVIHPPNEILCSDIIPRWAVIGWLLTTCTSNVAASNAKLALFFDWLFFDAEKDNIMNIEPGILVMFHSMRPHPAITVTLLDFLCRIMGQFYVPMADKIRQNVYSCLEAIINKQVLQTLEPLLAYPKMDKELRLIVQENFGPFLAETPEAKAGPSHDGAVPSSIQNQPEKHFVDASNSRIPDAEFSDDDDEEDVKVIATECKKSPVEQEEENLDEELDIIAASQPVDITTYLDKLPAEYQTMIRQLDSEKDNEHQCEFMENLVQSVMQELDLDDETATPLAVCLGEVLRPHFQERLFPNDIDDETLEDSIGTPLFVLFRHMCELTEEDPSRRSLLLLLNELYARQPRTGYMLLYFLKVSRLTDEKMVMYKDFCKTFENRSLYSCLMIDMRLCQEDDIRLFTYLIPDIYNEFSSIVVGSPTLMHLIVSSVDGQQQQELLWQILQGHLVMFKKESYVSVLSASLDWESIEQFFLWQLVDAHKLAAEDLIALLPKLDSTLHAEALTGLLMILKNESPSPTLLNSLFRRNFKRDDLFVVSMLKWWALHHQDTLADNIHFIFTACMPSPQRQGRRQKSSRKRSPDSPSIEQILIHLEHFRGTVKNVEFLTHESMQSALRFVQQSCSESQKAKFGDLLALVEDLEQLGTRRRVLRGRALNSSLSYSPGSRRKAENSSSSSSDSSDEETLNMKVKKRRKIDDSD